jgi:hypothetical protein
MRLRRRSRDYQGWGRIMTSITYDFYDLPKYTKELPDGAIEEYGCEDGQAIIDLIDSESWSVRSITIRGMRREPGKSEVSWPATLSVEPGNPLYPEIVAALELHCDKAIWEQVETDGVLSPDPDAIREYRQAAE